MQIVSNGDNLHEMSYPVFCENKEAISICWKFYPECLAIRMIHGSKWEGYPNKYFLFFSTKVYVLSAH